MNGMLRTCEFAPSRVAGPQPRPWTVFVQTVVSPGNQTHPVSCQPHARPPRRLLALAILAFLFAALPAAAASAAPVQAPLLPPGKKIFLGVTDTGTATGFRDFAAAINRWPAVIQTFHPWNNSLDKAMERWREVRARPMLHISTVQDDGAQVITPRGIAFGGGDDYLLYLNRTLSENGMLTYIRPLGEPNRCLNAYAAFDCAGKPRDARYKTRWYRQAIRRIHIIVHGGLKRGQVDRRLARLGMPPLSPLNTPVPRVLPAAPVALIWSPLPVGSPRAKGNFPGNFYPGNRYVDWVGTDFYSKYPHWKDLTRFYNRFAIKRRKPLALTEWGVWSADDPVFVKRLFTWVERRRLARMLVYYQDFGPYNEFRVQNFPGAAAVIRRRVAKTLYPQRAPDAPYPIPEAGGVTPASARRASSR